MSAKRAIKAPLALIFGMAVLVPSIALSVLALRAADRESAYVEKRLEGALLAEVSLAVGRVGKLLAEAIARLNAEAPALALHPAAAWREADPLVEVSFRLTEGEIVLPNGVEAGERAKFMADFGPFLLGVIGGSGDAASVAFNTAVTPHAATFGISALNLGSVAAIGGALGRTMSPIAGAAVICCGLAGVKNPMELAKRNALPMFAATVALAIMMLYMR
jgi:hypothetical protein